ncbi:MAG: PIN domain-containing protein [Candidatus Eiseniibacteriota bacterium]
MLAVDTNVLVFAEITTSPHHAQARAVLTELAQGTVPGHSVALHLRVPAGGHASTRVPSAGAVAPRAGGRARRLLDSPTLVLLQETPNHDETMMRVLRESEVSGNLIHDALIAALCIEHGVQELVTGDRDFGRFKPLKTRNPFEG